MDSKEKDEDIREAKTTAISRRSYKRKRAVTPVDDDNIDNNPFDADTAKRRITKSDSHAAAIRATSTSLPSRAKFPLPIPRPTLK